jgi:hypothetical protein
LKKIKKGLTKAKPPLILLMGVMRTIAYLFNGFTGKYNHETNREKWRQDKEKW